MTSNEAEEEVAQENRDKDLHQLYTSELGDNRGKEMNIGIVTYIIAACSVTNVSPLTTPEIEHGGSFTLIMAI